MKQGTEIVLDWKPNTRHEKTWKALARMWEQKARKKKGGKRHGR